MKLFLFAPAATLLALTLPSGTNGVSLRSVTASGSDKNEEDSVATVLFQEDNDKFLDATGTLIAKDQVKTNDATIVTPVYQSSNGFVVPDETSPFVKGQLDSIVGSTVDGALRSGFVKFRIGGMNVDKWSTIDIADFDSAIHEASNLVHGRNDGIYFAGEEIYKIVKVLGTDEDQEDTNLTNMAEVGKRRYWWFDTYSLDRYTCRYCPDDDASDYENYSIVQGGSSDPIFNPKSLNAIAAKACEILSSMGNSDFSGATDCSAEVVSPDEVAKVLMAEEVVVGAVSRAVSA